MAVFDGISEKYGFFDEICEKNKVCLLQNGIPPALGRFLSRGKNNHFTVTKEIQQKAKINGLLSPWYRV